MPHNGQVGPSHEKLVECEPQSSESKTKPAQVGTQEDPRNQARRTSKQTRNGPSKAREKDSIIWNRTIITRSQSEKVARKGMVRFPRQNEPTVSETDSVWRCFFLSGGPSSSAEVRGLDMHSGKYGGGIAYSDADWAGCTETRREHELLLDLLVRRLASCAL